MEESETRTLEDVHAVFGSGGDGEQEVWLYIQEAPGKIHYLQPAATPGLWEVLSQEDDADGAVVRKTWKGVAFMTTHDGNLTKKFSTQPFPPDEWEALVVACEAYEPVSESSEESS